MSTSQISRALSNVGEFPDIIETVPRVATALWLSRSSPKN
jgi:hypothetical protein